MITTLEKVRRLEQYIAADSSTVDPVLDMTIDKLLARELTRMLELKARLTNQAEEFEDDYSLKIGSSKEFKFGTEAGMKIDPRLEENNIIDAKLSINFGEDNFVYEIKDIEILLWELVSLWSILVFQADNYLVKQIQRMGK